MFLNIFVMFLKCFLNVFKVFNMFLTLLIFKQVPEQCNNRKEDGCGGFGSW